MHIKGFREAGINPWLTYRMNDYHSRSSPTSVLFSDFYHEHPEVRNGRDIPKSLWTGSDYAYDFKFEIVREHLLGIINESLERYDPYGIELDFQREMIIFALGEEYEGVEIMNGFMRDVKAIVTKAEARWGHKIKVAVRVMPDINSCFEYGFDIMKWVQEGILDTLVISARFYADTDMPIAAWKTLLAPYGVDLFAGIDYALCACQGEGRIEPNIDTFTACAANAFSQGADKFYLYNYYIPFHSRFDREGEFDFDPTHNLKSLEQYWTVINHVGDPDAILKMNRRHLITIKDRTPMWKQNFYQIPENRGINQLPHAFCELGVFRLIVGEIAKGAKVTFRFSVDDAERALSNPPCLYVNCVPCEFIGSERDERFTSHTLLCYDVPVSAWKTNFTAMIHNSTGDINVRYVDVFIKVRD